MPVDRNRSAIILGLAVGPLVAAVHLAAQQATAAGEEEPVGATYVGEERCAECHRDVADVWGRALHSRYISAKDRPAEQRGCEACHGPGGHHVAWDRNEISKPAKLGVTESSQICLACHQEKVTKRHWRRSAHARAKMTCTDCHEVHRYSKRGALRPQDPTELCLTCHRAKRLQFRMRSHHPVLEERLTCVDCHDPMGGGPGKLLRDPGATAVEAAPDSEATGLCLMCHAEKTGPFLHEHDPIRSGLSDGCLTCHKPHGSPNDNLRRLPNRGLCLQCHTDRFTHNPGSDCVNCHRRIHGSNANPLFFE